MGDVRVNPVLIQQIDGINLQALERAFDGLLDMLGPTIHGCHSGPIVAATQIEPELGGDHHFATERRKRLAHEFFVGERAVYLRGVKEGDAAVHRGVEKIGHLLLVFGGPVGKAHAHAAEPQS